MKDIRYYIARYIGGVPEGLDEWSPPPNIIQKKIIRILIKTYKKDRGIRAYLNHPLLN